MTGGEGENLQDNSSAHLTKFPCIEYNMKIIILLLLSVFACVYAKFAENADNLFESFKRSHGRM
jgi:hypothetical protein